ncbi:hypothetical protein [Ilumatobacter sp.]
MADDDNRDEADDRPTWTALERPDEPRGVGQVLAADRTHGPGRTSR